MGGIHKNRQKSCREKQDRTFDSGSALSIIVQKVKETNTMKETKIKLGLDDVKEFVEAAARCDFDIDVNYNRVFVDAKSILGVLALDLGKVLTVKCHGEDAAFEDFLQKYAVA